MKKAFTITELLVAIGLLAAVLAASSIVFHYSIDAQRTAAATTEIMRTLRSITDQINIDLGFKGLQTDGYLFLCSDDSNSAIYFFSTGDFQSWYDSDVRSNIARIYFGPSQNDPNNLALDMRLLTPGVSPIPLDCCDVSFAKCQTDITANFEDPCEVLSSDRPDVNMARDPNDARRLLAQHVGSFKIEWTYGWVRQSAPDQIVWWGFDDIFSDEIDLVKPGVIPIPVLQAEMLTITAAIQENKNLGPPAYYTVRWDPANQQYWPKALKFTFMLYDSKGILKAGRRFEHIVYIGK